MTLDDKIETLPKIQKPHIAALKKLGLNTARDLLLYFPYRYLDFSQTRQIKDLKPGENVSLKVKINSISGRFAMYGRMALAEAIVSDETGSIKVVWFNQPYLAKSLSAGEEIFLAGAADYYKSRLQLTNPIYEKVSDFPIHTSRMVPLYHLKQGLYLKTFRNFVASVIDLAAAVDDALPPAIIKNQALMNIADTIRQSHFPENDQIIVETRKRLAFEEIFYNQLLAQKHKLDLAKKQSYKVKFDQKLIKSFVESLPFKLTSEQKKAAWDILQDLEKPMPMNRLLEGDVGSGKTAVALISAIQAISEGYQVVLLAPTEILANQHYQTAQKLTYNKMRGHAFYYMSLLTNNFSQLDGQDITKVKLKELIKQGMPGLYIGTHALLQKGVKFKKLALVIIDEQHRFGVEQRAELMKVKSGEAGSRPAGKKVPHLLSLSATPIPRTLQLAVYGELDISQIKNKPLGRKAIITKLVTDENRTKAYQFINAQIKLGRQAFVITPLIEESDKLGVKSAKSEAENLKKIFPQFEIGLMHGRLKGSEKESVMKDFLENKTQILVSTSVVEVGVDVPNASVMLIEGAERFGLSQLHQFRGRVGRAQHQSYCFLFMTPTTSPRFAADSSLKKEENTAAAVSPPFQGGVAALADGVVGVKNETITRLESFTKTQNGFELAELDLKQRGFGEIYGSTQSGWNFKYFDPSYTSLIQPARQEALAILRDDINLDNYPLLKEKIKGKIVHFE